MGSIKLTRLDSRLLPAALLVVHCRYLILVPKLLPAATLVVHRRAVFIYRGAQADTRGARCASKILERCARPLPAAPRRYLGVVPRPLPAVAPVVRRGYLSVVPKPMPAAPLVDFRKFLIVVPRSLPRRRDAAAAGEEHSL